MHRPPAGPGGLVSTPSPPDALIPSTPYRRMLLVVLAREGFLTPRRFGNWEGCNSLPAGLSACCTVVCWPCVPSVARGVAGKP